MPYLKREDLISRMHRWHARGANLLNVFQELFKLFGGWYVGQFEFNGIVDARNVGEHDIRLESASHHFVGDCV